MRNLALSGLAAISLSACGGAERQTFDALNDEAYRLFYAQDGKPITRLGRAELALSGGASFSGVAYGNLRSGAEDPAYFRSAMDIEVDLASTDTQNISGQMTNFVTEDEQQLAGSLSFEGNMRGEQLVSGPGPVLHATFGSGPYGIPLTGNLESPFTGDMVPVSASVNGAAIGYDANWIGGNIRDTQGPLRINGSFVTER